jgi:hypothetical protein
MNHQLRSVDGHRQAIIPLSQQQQQQQHPMSHQHPVDGQPLAGVLQQQQQQQQQHPMNHHQYPVDGDPVDGQAIIPLLRQQQQHPTHHQFFQRAPIIFQQPLPYGPPPPPVHGAPPPHPPTAVAAPAASTTANGFGSRCVYSVEIASFQLQSRNLNDAAEWFNRNYKCSNGSDGIVKCGQIRRSKPNCRTQIFECSCGQSGTRVQLVQEQHDDSNQPDSTNNNMCVYIVLADKWGIVHDHFKDRAAPANNHGGDVGGAVVLQVQRDSMEEEEENTDTDTNSLAEEDYMTTSTLPSAKELAAVTMEESEAAVAMEESEAAEDAEHGNNVDFSDEDENHTTTRISNSSSNKENGMFFKNEN